MRLIDADALYEELRYMPYDNILECTIGHEKPLIAIVSAPTVEMPGWISVQDRLPDREGLYLCWSAINGVEACYQIHLWKDGRWYWVHDVRYWMPLPEPPEERKTEEEDKTGWFSDESPTPAP